MSAQAVVSLQLGRGAPQAVALGDALGGVMLLRPTGELLVDFDSGATACSRAVRMQPPHTEAIRRNLLRGVTSRAAPTVAGAAEHHSAAPSKLLSVKPSKGTAEILQVAGHSHNPATWAQTFACAPMCLTLEFPATLTRHLCARAPNRLCRA